MVTKSKKATTKKGRVNVGKLKLNKETVKDLTGGEGKQVKGGLVVTVHYLCVPVQTVACITAVCVTNDTCCPKAGCGPSR